jgi:hypothetical protein
LKLELIDEVLPLDGELLDLWVRLAQHLHEAVVRATPHGQVDLTWSGHRHRATKCGCRGHQERTRGGIDSHWGV